MLYGVSNIYLIVIKSTCEVDGVVVYDFDRGGVLSGFAFELAQKTDKTRLLQGLIEMLLLRKDERAGA
jgi:hypothetical protein